MLPPPITKDTVNNKIKSKKKKCLTVVSLLRQFVMLNKAFLSMKEKKEETKQYSVLHYANKIFFCIVMLSLKDAFCIYSRGVFVHKTIKEKEFMTLERERERE